jgi:hypothetical protein
VPLTCNCPTCGCLLQLPEEHLGRRAICPKCSAEFAPSAPLTLPASPAPEAIETAPEVDPFPNRATHDDGHYLTTHPRVQRRLLEEEDEDHPSERFLARGLPGGGRALAVIILLGLTILCDVAGLAVDSLQYRQVEDSIHGIKPNQAQATLNDTLELGLGALDFLLTIATGVLFCVWTYRAYKNLRRLGVRGLKHSPGWAVGFFFIPFVNLYKPCVVFLEMWKASDPAAPANDAYAWQERSGGVLIGFWWTCWIIAGVMAQVSGHASVLTRHPGLHELEIRIVLLALARLVSILAAVLAIFVVMRIQGREKESYRRLGEVEPSHMQDGSEDEDR